MFNVDLIWSVVVRTFLPSLFLALYSSPLLLPFRFARDMALLHRSCREPTQVRDRVDEGGSAVHDFMT